MKLSALGVKLMDNLELGPKFKNWPELGLDVFYRVHELGPGILIKKKLKLGFCSLLLLPKTHHVDFG